MLGHTPDAGLLAVDGPLRDAHLHALGCEVPAGDLADWQYNAAANGHLLKDFHDGAGTASFGNGNVVVDLHSGGRLQN